MADSNKPRAENRRRHLRVELYATVTLKGSDETFILSLRNLSLGGAFLLADGHDLSTVKVGGEHEVVIVDGDHPDAEIAVRARVVRNTADGLALQWIGEKDTLKVASLLDLYSPAGELLAVRPADGSGATAQRDGFGCSALAWLGEVLRRKPVDAGPLRDVRLKLEALPSPLRAVARDQARDGLMIEAELPWLTIGSAVEAELPDGPRKGRVDWFGIDATRAGTARLRILVDLMQSEVPTAQQAVNRTRGQGSARPRSRSHAFWPTIAAACALCGLVGGLAVPRSVHRALLTPAPEVEPARLHWPRTIPKVFLEAPDARAHATTNSKHHHNHHRHSAAVASPR